MNRALLAIACLSIFAIVATQPAAGQARLWESATAASETFRIYEPFDFPAVHIRKIENYRISDQEAMGFSIPYRSTNGWNQFWR